MLKELLEEKNCFKLICGAGNEDLIAIRNLVAIFSKAGCKFFDLNASKEALEAAQKGLDFSIKKEAQKEYSFCISVGTKNDVHLNKTQINQNLCKKCGKCIEICPQKAINKSYHTEENIFFDYIESIEICKLTLIDA